MTQELLHKLLHYNTTTGIFTSLKTNKPVGSKHHKGHLRYFYKPEKKAYRLHRLAFLYMTGSMPIEHVDHINRIPDDNRWCNLREISNLDNQKNKSISKLNTSGTTGVNYNKKRDKWTARIGTIVLGHYINKSDAIQARYTAEIEHGYTSEHGK